LLFTDYRENIMPESPSPKLILPSPPTGMAGGTSARDVPRPHSRGSTLSGSVFKHCHYSVLYKCYTGIFPMY